MATRPRALGILILAAAALTAQTSPLRSAHAKIARIEYDRAAPGSTTVLTESELTAYATEQAEIIAPGAIHQAALTLTPGRAQASASINFLRVQQAEGESPGWLLRQLLGGERPVTITVRIQSSGGRARVDVERVEVSGVLMEGSTLDFLLRQFVVPNFPDARVGEWFTLGHRIDRLDIRPGAAAVILRR